MDLDLEYKELTNVPVNVDESTNPNSASTTTHEVRGIGNFEFAYASFETQMILQQLGCKLHSSYFI